jgi:aminoglycoside/choline kinase family phosphotransferase
MHGSGCVPTEKDSKDRASSLANNYAAPTAQPTKDSSGYTNVQKIHDANEKFFEIGEYFRNQMLAVSSSTFLQL